MILDEILSDIEAIEKDRRLYDEKNFNLRLQAIDDIEFHVIDRLDALIENATASEQLNFLKQYAEKVKRDLEDVNAKLFQQLREKISCGLYKGKEFLALIDEYVDIDQDIFHQQEVAGYDCVDMFLNGILTNEELPAEIKEREPGMIYYQKTPARIILELVKKAAFKPADVFFDLGSGLGQVAILVNLSTRVASKGVEFEPAFCNYANTRAAELNLSDVEFINTNARYADYSMGTIFFMYTPFEGKILKEVLHNLKGESKKRKIKVFTYGSCTEDVARQNWLINSNGVENCVHELGAFVSVE